MGMRSWQCRRQRSFVEDRWTAKTAYVRPSLQAIPHFHWIALALRSCHTRNALQSGYRADTYILDTHGRLPQFILVPSIHLIFKRKEFFRNCTLCKELLCFAIILSMGFFHVKLLMKAGMLWLSLTADVDVDIDIESDRLAPARESHYILTSSGVQGTMYCTRSCIWACSIPRILLAN